MNDNNYIYGNRGFETNEYLVEIDSLLANYKKQEEVIVNLNSKIRYFENKINNLQNLTDDDYKKMYARDYEFNQNKSFEQYKKDIQLENQRIINNCEKEIADLKTERTSKLNLLKNDISLETIQSLNNIKRDLELQYKEKSIELDRINLEAEKPETTDEMRRKLRDEYDKIFNQYKKIEKALARIDEEIRNIKINKEVEVKAKAYNYSLSEYNKMLEIYKKHLSAADEYGEKYKNNEISYDEYLEIFKFVNKKYDEITKEYTKMLDLYNEIQTLDPEYAKGLVKAEEPAKPNKYEKINEIENNKFEQYNKLLSDYKKILAVYNEELALLPEKLKKYQNKEITKEEYTEYYNSLKENYEFVFEKYTNLKEMYDGLTEKYGDEAKDLEEPEKPKQPTFKEKKKIVKKQKKSHLILRSILAIAAGMGIGTAVHFFGGPVGGLILAGTSLVGGLLLRKAKMKAKSFEELKKIDDIDLPSNKLKQSIKNIKNYFKSKEGLRDLSWMLTSSFYTNAALNLISALIPNEPTNAGPEQGGPEQGGLEQGGPEQGGPVVEQGTITTEPEIVIGESTNGFNVEYGHDTAAEAISNINSEHLNQNILNGSQFGRFRATLPDGSVVSSNQPGISLTDFSTQYGIPKEHVAIDLVDKTGSLAWSSVEDLTSTIGKVR